MDEFLRISASEGFREDVRASWPYWTFRNCRSVSSSVGAASGQVLRRLQRREGQVLLPRLHRGDLSRLGFKPAVENGKAEAARRDSSASAGKVLFHRR